MINQMVRAIINNPLFPQLMQVMAEEVDRAFQRGVEAGVIQGRAEIWQAWMANPNQYQNVSLLFISFPIGGQGGGVVCMSKHFFFGQIYFSSVALW